LLSLDDPNADPRTNTNNTTLLDGTQNTTINLMCGVDIEQPLPVVSLNDQLITFEYHRFMVREIPERPNFPTLETPPVEFIPLEPDGSLENNQQWNNVRNAWTTPGMGTDAASRTVSMWQAVGESLLGWDPKKLNGTNGQPLSGTMPTVLVADLEDYYGWAPDLSGTVVNPVS
jgi:hypothetical protein